MLEEKLNQDYIAAMKAKDAVRSSTISFLRAQVKNVRIDRRLEKVEDADVIAVIKKQIKQRQESIEQYKAGNRQDLVEKESAELAILKSYLPEEMSEGLLKQIIADALKEAQATSMKDMGKVMKIVTTKVAGNADNKVVSELVKQSLSSL
jgi:uncharacterized protein YqeY